MGKLGRSLKFGAWGGAICAMVSMAMILFSDIVIRIVQYMINPTTAASIALSMGVVTFVGMCVLLTFCQYMKED